MLTTIQCVGIAIIGYYYDDGNVPHLVTCNDFFSNLLQKESLINLTNQQTVCLFGNKNLHYNVIKHPVETNMVGVPTCCDDYDECYILEVLDTTEHYIAEKRLHHILDNMSDGFFDWYIVDDYEYMSPRFWQMFGYESHEKEHHPREWMSIIFQDDLELAMQNFHEHVVSHGEVPYNVKVRYHHKNGSIVWVICKGSVIEWGPNWEPIRIVGCHVDITKEINNSTEMKIAEATKNEIEKALHERKALVNYVFHEVRNPMNVISTGIMILKEEISTIVPKATLEVLEMMERSVKRARHILNDTIDYSKLENGTFSLALNNFNICKILEEVTVAFAPAAKEKNITLLFEPPDQPIMCIVDEFRLEQVFNNLLTNALKFTNEGGTITITLSVDNANVRINFTDSGCGISTIHLASIFKPYYQTSDKKSTDIMGMGLGLTISKMIVEAHHGKLLVTSEKDVGSTFTCVLKLSNPISDHLTHLKGLFASSKLDKPLPKLTPTANKCYFSPDLKERKAIEKKVSIENVHVLVVDDDPVNRKIMARMLHRKGYKVHTLNDGVEFVQMVERGEHAHIHCVILDELMPRMNGTKALEICRTEYSFNLPVLMISGCATDEYHRKFKQLNVTEIIDKPIDANRLLNVIEKITDLPNTKNRIMKTITG